MSDSALYIGMLRMLKQHNFTLCLLVSVAFAFLFPGPGSKGGFLHPEWSTQLGVWFIFLFQGLSLPMQELIRGYSPKRFHVYVLSWNFLLFPCVVAICILPLQSFVSEPLQIGFYFLAILPTTVASAITFTAISGGDRANALFSTVFSNLLAVITVPILTLAYLSADAEVHVSVLPIFLKLLGLIVFPLFLGQWLSVRVLPNAAKYTKLAKSLSQWIILFIVYVAFAQSVQSGLLQALSVGEIIAVLLMTLSILFVVSILVWWGSRLLKLTHAQRVAAFFCASQKSLATGLPLATMILLATPGDLDGAGMLIPLMCYHPAQLFLAGFISGRWALKRQH